MHTTTDAKTLADALAVLKRYAGNGNGQPKAAAVAELRVPDDGNALIVRRFATKTETDATASIAADRTTAGTVHVNADALAAAIKGASGPVTVAIDGDRVTVRAAAGTASLPVFDAADFPAGPYDAVVMNPPRKGANPSVLGRIVESGIPRVVYVSCNPSSLARDLLVLTDAGFAILRPTGRHSRRVPLSIQTSTAASPSPFRHTSQSP